MFSSRPAEPVIQPEMRSLIQRLALHSNEIAAVRTVAFIAARPDEGTSTIAFDYATALANQMGQKVLLIDAGPFNGERYRNLKIGEPRAIVDAIATEAPVASAPQVIGTTGVSIARWVIGAQHHALGARLMRDTSLWSLLLGNFDTIIIDAPNLQQSFDGVVLAANADAAIMVVEAESTRRPVVENLRDTLIGAGARVAGIVMNKRRFYIPRWVYRRM